MYLLLVVALFSVVGIWAAWDESRQPDADDFVRRRPAYWFLLALAYAVAAVAVVAIGWWYV